MPFSSLATACSRLLSGDAIITRPKDNCFTSRPSRNSTSSTTSSIFTNNSDFFNSLYSDSAVSSSSSRTSDDSFDCYVRDTSTGCYLRILPSGLAAEPGITPPASPTIEAKETKPEIDVKLLGLGSVTQKRVWRIKNGEWGLHEPRVNRMSSKEIGANKTVNKSEGVCPTDCGPIPLCSPGVVDVEHQEGAQVSEASEHDNSIESNHLQQQESREMGETPTSQAPRATQVNTVTTAPRFSAPFQRLADLKERMAKNKDRKGERLGKRQRIKRAVKTSVSIVQEAFRK